VKSLKIVRIRGLCGSECHQRVGAGGRIFHHLFQLVLHLHGQMPLERGFTPGKHLNDGLARRLRGRLSGLSCRNAHNNHQQNDWLEPSVEHDTTPASWGLAPSLVICARAGNGKPVRGKVTLDRTQMGLGRCSPGSRLCPALRVVLRRIQDERRTARGKLSSLPLLERTLTGFGAETVMRVPQTEQSTHPLCSKTEGTVLNLRKHLGHSTSMI